MGFSLASDLVVGICYTSDLAICICHASDLAVGICLASGVAVGICHASDLAMGTCLASDFRYLLTPLLYTMDKSKKKKHTTVYPLKLIFCWLGSTTNNKVCK